MQLSIIAAILATIVGVAFAMQNTLVVTVNFMFWSFDSSLAMVLMLALALGAIIIALLTTPVTLRRQWTMTRQKRRIEELENMCAAQQSRITHLEQYLPAETLAEEQRPYAGLKQLISGREKPLPDTQSRPFTVSDA